MYCFVKGCTKLIKVENPELKLGFCDEHLDGAGILIKEYVIQVTNLKNKLYEQLRNLKEE